MTACKAPDGSYWALQAWQRMLPNYGVDADRDRRLSGSSGSRTGRASCRCCRFSTDWAWHQWDHLFGTFTYDGSPVLRLPVDAGGKPLDTFGRNIYVDTLDSAYGPGWKRENSFLTHTGTGAFCYSVNPHGVASGGQGNEYRATVDRPGRHARRHVARRRAGRVRQERSTRRERADLRSSATSSARPTEARSARLAPVEDRGAEQRALFRRWPAGVSVVVAEVDGRRAGLTVSSLVSLSLEPPLVGISIALEASLHELLREAGEWTASMLSGDQEALAQHFARSVPPIALWNGIDVREDDPRLLVGAVGWLDRAHSRRAATGDHTFFVGEMLSRSSWAPPTTRSPTSTTAYKLAVIARRRLRPGRRDRRLRAGVGRGASSSTRARRAARTPKRRARDMMGMSSPEWSRYMAESLGVPGTPEQINAAIVERMLERYGEAPPLIPGAVDAVRGSRARGRSRSRRRRTRS